MIRIFWTAHNEMRPPAKLRNAGLKLYTISRVYVHMSGQILGLMVCGSWL